MSSLFVCSQCSQSWTSGELAETGSQGEFLWECPGCQSLQNFSSEVEEVEDLDVDVDVDEEFSEGDSSELAIYECHHCDQRWTHGELVAEERLADWAWSCPGCHELNKEDSDD